MVLLSGVPHLVDVLVDADSADACCADDDCSPVCSAGCCGGARVVGVDVVVVANVNAAVVVEVVGDAPLARPAIAPPPPDRASVFHPPKV